MTTMDDSVSPTDSLHNNHGLPPSSPGGTAPLSPAQLHQQSQQQPVTVNAIDPVLLKTHLDKLLPILIDADPIALKKSLWNHPRISDKLSSFITDPSVSFAAIVKERVLSSLATPQTPGGSNNDENNTNAANLLVDDNTQDNVYTYSFHTEFLYRDTTASSVAIIKRVPVIESTRSISSQLQLIHIPGPQEGGNAYETLHSLIHNAVAPFFDAYVSAKGGSLVLQARDEKEAKTGIPMAKKKIAELELSLLHLQQNVEIPEITLSIHPQISKALERARLQSRKVSVEDLGDLVNDSSFLNRLQSDVNGWIKEIQKVTKLDRDPSSGTASQEINFWLMMERALTTIEEQLKSDEIVLTMEVLKNAKRFHATVSFLADTGLKESTEKVHKYNQLMKDFPLNELLSATDVDKIRESLVLIFSHINKKLRSSPYPIRRALPLVEAISKDLNEQLLKALGSRRLMYMDYEEFERSTMSTQEVFVTWDELVKEFTNVARELTRKRSEKFLPIKIHGAHVKLQERVEFVRAFRRQHETLHSTILKVMRSDAKDGSNNAVVSVSGDKAGKGRQVALYDLSAVDDVNNAYEVVKNINVLDVSVEGTEIWVAAETAYNERVSRVENQIIARLRDRLATCKTAQEMFRVFSKFNALFVRPKIRGAIQEYQTQLIDSVKEDIRKLQEKFKLQYRQSEAYRMSQSRDIPPIAGAISWARQIERQLSLYMKRVEDVLGKGWELYAEGQKLQNESLSFRRKLDTKALFEQWLNEILRRDLSVSGRIFDIVRNRSQGNQLVLQVSFESHIVTLFKEVRNLLWMGYQVPHTISNVAKDAKRVYPYAVSLSETIRMFSVTNGKVARNELISPLIASYKKDVQTCVSKGIHLRWDYFVNVYDHPQGLFDGKEHRHLVFVRDLATLVSVYTDKVNAAVSICDDIHAAVEELKTCAFKRSAFKSVLDKIQKLIDQLNLENYSNLERWVKSLDSRIEHALIQRLHAAVKSWVSEFLNQSDDRSLRGKSKFRQLQQQQQQHQQSDAAGDHHNDETRPHLSELVLEIKIRNQFMYVDPPVEATRSNWYGQLHAWLSNVCSLERVSSSRYAMGLEVVKSPEDLTYTGLLTKLNDNVLEKTYLVIENMVSNVQDYVATWLQFQSLWDLESNMIDAHLGDDLTKWQQLVLEIKKSRSTFDNTENYRLFGSVVVDYEQVESKVNAKYDNWQREILNKFGARLATAMRDFYTTISKARYDLEQTSLDSNSTSDTVAFITFVQDLKRKLPLWTDRAELFRSGQKTLERQRYQFPSDWLYSDQVDGEWSAFNEIMNRKNSLIQKEIAGLQLKIVAEDKVIEQRIRDIVIEWEKTKPVQGDIKPDDANNTLAIFEGRVTRLKEEYEQICRAKEALALDLAVDDRLEPVLEEVRDLKSVWQALSAVWSSVFEMRDMVWASVVPRKIRQQLDSLLTGLKEMPSRMRQYAAYEYVQEVLKTHIRTNLIVSDLKSDAMKERHWRQLFKSLRIETRGSLSEMTLGHVWAIDLKKNETVIKEVITIAQGEMALEEFMKQVRECWMTYALDLVNYQNKCRLIRGWDDLFAKCSEHLNSLQAMKHSPYYKVFEEEAVAWEDKLNRVHVLFDVWIDVQRQWVYLEGIFSGSVDIKHLLPIETSRFQNINTEFMAVMKKVYRSPQVLDVLNIPNIQKSLERLADLLSKIQKALGEYLERERSSFPRFYFVGDEDLLEIIGNSKDVVRIQKHFKKMFAGIASIVLTEDASIITGITSKEGEVVHFKTPISIKNSPRINDWLTLLENEMRTSLALLLTDAANEINSWYYSEQLDSGKFLKWVEKFPAQLVVLASQLIWTQSVEKALGDSAKAPELLRYVLALVERDLNVLADTVLMDLPTIMRKKCEHLITELVHQRDVIRQLIREKVSSAKDFQWLYQMRFYFNVGAPVLSRLTIQMANATFQYGYEYLGVVDRLVQTPLTDRCYLTLTQALESKMGGSPFGPAGTGKTESVKALGAQLGRFVLVFCCDENFDFQAMGRIFVGLSQVGAWGCFDEFNRLEERILSAVSQQIQMIQMGLREGNEVDLVGKTLKVNPDTGVFVTMNPGYAGRSNLPDNLKKLFRNVAMTKPDRELIAQVMLYSQGFRSAELLASKVVPFFSLCLEQLSPQSHYDFGLRSLKNVLVSAGNVKREKLQVLRSKKAELESVNGSTDESMKELTRISEPVPEQQILIQSIRETVVPKLVADDISLLQGLLSDVFPGINYEPSDLGKLKESIAKICAERRLVCSEHWMDKVIQLFQIQNIHHGLMMVGPSGSGKSIAWQVLLKALEKITGVESVSYVIDPKGMSKDQLYGSLDPTTREWTDGLFTHLLRKIVDDVRGESSKRHWIIFDGDVDPEWVENLNSVLDDNKLLTLPNGERLNLPHNVRIMFEVENLRYATLATVSRCGMVWFSEDIVSLPMMFTHYLETLRQVPLDDPEEEATVGGSEESAEASRQMQTQRMCADVLAPHFTETGMVAKALDFAQKLEHIMDFTKIRALNTLFTLLNKSVRDVLDYNAQHPDFPMAPDNLESYILKKLVVDVIWSFTGDAKLELRAQFGEFIRSVATIDIPPASNHGSVIDWDVDLRSSDWFMWKSKVPTIEIETHNVSSADVVIPTVDTVRHEELLYSWLSEHKPVILCGPPGSGKTMTLFSALRKLPDMEVAGLNFSSATTPDLILRTFEQYCEYRKTPSGMVLSPTALGRWLVVFCDEINLPAQDKYGTQRVISFLRQLVEYGGFWRTSDKTFVKLERIQFVGACNPPTDPGRVPMTHRFLRHVPLIMVDYPGQLSLTQIYSTFSRAMLKLTPTLRGYAEPLTNAMVEFYLESQKRFTPDIQGHYIYSPRELTRWVRGIYEAIKPLESLSVEGLVRIWAHEALRLFQDRLVSDDERKWTDEYIDFIATKHFPTISRKEALRRPILFSNWLSKNYVPVEREQLREFVKARLKVFYEEELDVPLVLFNDVLEHVLRIDRVFRQVQGHLLLIGVSGSGKTTLSRFVAWMNGLSVFQIKVHNKYSAADFDEDLRTVLRRAGCKNEKICFIMDESNVMDSGFLERMNTLLANAEIPGLFEGDEFSALMTQCKEGAQRDGVILDSQEELYKWFTNQIMKNLHVVFTMNPPEEGLSSRAATSPALFNRCVLDWFGNWSDQAFYQVGKEFTDALDIDLPGYAPPADFPLTYVDLPMPPTYRNAIVNAFVYVHQSLYEINAKLGKRQGRHNYATPRHYLDFINHFVKLYHEKREDLEDQQRHLNVGLDKLHETVIKVEELRKSLAIKKAELESKNEEANEKLKHMVAQQQEAEKKKAMSLEMQSAIAKQTSEISARQKIVKEDLSNVEPAVSSALNAVSNIKKQHLTEMRSMANPPETVKMTLEAVCVMLGHTVDGWKSVQSLVRRDDFIASIVNYETEKRLTTQIREYVRQHYLSNPNFVPEVVLRASMAAGPLAVWAISQVHYSTILEKVGPLRSEVAKLEKSADETKAKAATIDKTIKELEFSINRYKDEYAVLISDVQTIKTKMEAVKAKVDRSLTLIDNLSSEKQRWENTSENFGSQIGTIVGDVLLSSAFIAYAGYFDQQYREMLMGKLRNHLLKSGIKFKMDLSLPEFLSTADVRMSWQANSLPADDLCTENAIMLNRFNRYPLIIDPSGQATTFLMNEYKDRKITVTSFLDDSFLKVLESALRFGNPILIQDVENLDPILNPILNRELRRTGGRVLIRLGGNDIDFSPSFTLFLSTRDPSVNFPPDICSRVTFVNFTVTRSSLQSQCLHQVLKSERPDTDKKRTDLLKLQGEFQLRLRHLEKGLLQALSDSKGNILDDDHVLTTLETLKKEAGDISRKVKETDMVMEEVNAVTAIYTPLAQFCSSIYFVMEQLSLLHHFYQFSLNFFLEIFDFVLHKNPTLKSATDPKERLKIIIQDIFKISYRRASRALFHDDYFVFAILLAQIKLRKTADQIDDMEYDFLLDSTDPHKLHSAAATSITTVVGEEAASRVAACAALPAFKGLVHHVQTHGPVWQAFMADSAPEYKIPKCWAALEGESSTVSAFRRLLVIKCFRPDRLVQAAHMFVETVFGASYFEQTDLDLKTIVFEEAHSSTPLAFCSPPGYDASYRVEHFASAEGVRIMSVAMGSAEGFTLAESAISHGIKTGSWVLLKNVHLAPSWLGQLEKKLHTLRPNKDFRLFLTMETSPKVPVNLLRLSHVLTFEPPPGIRANLQETLGSISSARANKGPMEKARLYFLLAWLHAIVQERLSYAPMGWSKTYDFNDSDHDCALNTIDIWIETIAQGRSNISPDKIPWDAIRTLIKETVYGGKIDNEFDQQLLDSFVDRFFTPKAFELDFSLVESSEDGKKVLVPEGTKLEHFISWTRSLPEQQPPSWLSLPNNAEKVLMASKGASMLGKIRKMKSLTDDEVAYSPESHNKGIKLDEPQQPSWMKSLYQSTQRWLLALPESVSSMVRHAESYRDPLFRFFERENSIACDLLKTVRNDLSQLQLVCEGKLKQTNHLRSLLGLLNKGIIPQPWLRYKVPSNTSLNAWISDFAKRLAQVEAIAKQQRLDQIPLWIGGLFMAEAYITATRQTVAQKNKWSLEELTMEVIVGDHSNTHGFVIEGLRLEGAEWKNGQLELSSTINTKLPPMKLCWVKTGASVATPALHKTSVPIYLTRDRKDLLFTAKLSVREENVDKVLQRGVCVLAH